MRNRPAQRMRRQDRAALLSSDEAHRLVAPDPLTVVPAIIRKEDTTALALAHALTRDAAVSLGQVRHATPHCADRLLLVNQAEQCLKQALVLVAGERAVIAGERT